jgi:DNA-binding PadR family transcriptional regulator
LLLLLGRDEAHGYALLTELERFGFNPERLDPSLVYRVLREMEADGWVKSKWAEESQGPKRRVYSLSEMGANQLKSWIEELRRTGEEIGRLIKAYEELEESSSV